MEPEEDGMMSYKTYADISNILSDAGMYSDKDGSLAEMWLAKNKDRVARKQARQDARKERKNARKAAQDEAIKKLAPGMLGVAIGVGAALLMKKKQEENKKKNAEEKSFTLEIEDEIEVVEEAAAGQCTLVITNLTDVDTEVVLFGANKNQFAVNYGNNPAIHLQIANSNTATYAQLLAMTAVQPFEVSCFRFLCDNENQLRQTIALRCTDPLTGTSFTTPLSLWQHMTANQLQSTVVDVRKKTIIDANLEITFTLKANTKFVITMFKTAQKFTDMSDLLLDKKEDTNAGVNFLLQNGLLESEPNIVDPFNKGNTKSELSGFETNEGMPIIQGLAED